MLKWDHRYELGHERIDAEHKIFLGLIVDFNEAAKKHVPKDKLVRMLLEISKYAEFHFLSEENIMIEYRYPGYSQHAHLHQILLEQIKDHYTQFCSDAINADDVFEFLFEWFALHTSNEDKKLVGYLD